jgi:hypothetical protein
MHELLWRVISPGSYWRGGKHGFTNQTSCCGGRDRSGSQDSHLSLWVSVRPFEGCAFGIGLVNRER